MDENARFRMIHVIVIHDGPQDGARYIIFPFLITQIIRVIRCQIFQSLLRPSELMISKHNDIILGDYFYTATAVSRIFSYGYSSQLAD